MLRRLASSVHGSLVAEGAVRPYGVEVLAPLLDQHLVLPESVEHLTIQQLIP
jgi:hypothetical protein